VGFTHGSHGYPGFIPPEWTRDSVSGGLRFFLPEFRDEAFYIHRIGRDDLAGEDEVVLVGDGPFDLLGLGEVQGLGEGGREVDVALPAVFAFDELYFGG
jgi:hypothetical protein